MLPDDISNIYAEFDRVHAVTPLILQAQLSPQTLPSIDAHKVELNDVIGSLEDLETYYDGLKKDAEIKKKQATDARKKLERNFEDCKARYWSLRKEFDRNPLQKM